MFLACARAHERDGEGLYDTNYYLGLRDSENFGRSSRHYGTGTVAWMLMLLMEELCGARATMEGLMLQPCIPEGWNHISCSRKYRNARYHITVQRGQERAVYVDGKPYQGMYLAAEDGKCYEVKMIV